MKLVTYKGDYGYCVIDGEKFRPGVELEVADAVAAKAKSSEEPFEVKDVQEEKGD